MDLPRVNKPKLNFKEILREWAAKGSFLTVVNGKKNIQLDFVTSLIPDKIALSQSAPYIQTTIQTTVIQYVCK